MGQRVTLLPRNSAMGLMPGNALETDLGSPSVPRASRRRSIIVRPAGINVSITNKLSPTPNPATIPKSPMTPMGENRVAKKLTMVVTAAKSSGMVTRRSPRRIAGATAKPSRRSSR